MRPNFTFGPLDSIAQYLLYLSIVVLGVVLPFLLQKWRERRSERSLLEVTIDSLNAEINFNRERATKSLETLTTFLQLLHSERDFFLDKWKALVTSEKADAVGTSAVIVDRDSTASVNFSVLQTTAWDVAREAGALRLLPREKLVALTLLYRGHVGYEQARNLAMTMGVRSNIMSLPIDVSSRAAVEARLDLIVHVKSSVAALSGSLIQMNKLFDDAQRALQHK
jgi:hypothetical protein